MNLTITNVDTGITNSGNTLTAIAIGAVYRWLDCNNNYSFIPGETARSFTASGIGSYAVEVSQNGCTDTSACTQINMVSLSEMIQITK